MRRDEQELTICIVPRGLDTRAEIFATIPKYVRRLREMMTGHEDEVSVISDDDTILNISVPPTWIKIAPPRKCRMTDEQKQYHTEKLREYRMNKGVTSG